MFATVLHGYEDNCVRNKVPFDLSSGHNSFLSVKTFNVILTIDL